MAAWKADSSAGSMAARMAADSVVSRAEQRERCWAVMLVPAMAATMVDWSESTKAAQKEEKSVAWKAVPMAAH